MRPVLSALIYLLSIVASAQVPAPTAAKVRVVDTYAGGLTVSDDYRWLEDGAAPATRQWVAAENAHTASVLDGLPQRDKILAFLKKQNAETHTRYRSFQSRAPRIFALRYDPLDSSAKLVTFDSPTDKASERQILNLGKLTPGTSFQCSWYSVSPDGKLVGMALSTGGSEDGSLHVFSTLTGQPADVVLPHVQFATAGGSMAWKADSSGFFYTRYPRGPERPAQDANFFQQLYFHKLGTPTSADAYVLGRELPRIAEILVSASPDKSHILVTVANGDGGEYEFFVVGPDSSIHQVCKFSDKVVSAAFGTDNSLWLLSHLASSRGEMLHLASVVMPFSSARRVVPVSDASLETEFATSDRLFLTVINGGPEQVRVYMLDGKRLSDLALPPLAEVGAFVRAGADESIVSVATYTSPPQWYSVSHGAEVKPLPFRFESATSLADLQVERVYSTSKDGTRVPVTLLHRKGLKRDGNNPTILYGYGGYGISMTPWFDIAQRLFYDAGGIYAIANIRGGGEYGEDWHQQGSLLHKQNVFDDFAASARFLIDQHYTSSPRLAGEGDSNGGLLMGAMITQHPSLFHAIWSEVGIYDMLRIELDPNGAFNTTEFGSTSDLAQLKYLFGYSPYHHVVEGTAYPATIFVTGDNDNRVNPAQSRKMTALLQADNSSKAPILLLTNANAGHGVSTNIDEGFLEEADALAFIYDQIGVDVP